MSQYCFDIKLDSNSTSINENDLKLFIRKLYKNSKYKNSFEDMDDLKLPYVFIFSKDDNTICIQLTSKSKKVIEKINSINEQIKDNDLIFNKYIKFSKPYLYEEDKRDWYNTNECKLVNLKGIRWTTLSHNGPYFAHIEEPYIPLNASIIYDNKKYALSPTEEMAARLYANRIISESKGNITLFLTKDKIFNNNYWKDFQTYLSPIHKKIFTDFSKIKFDDLIEQINNEKKSPVNKNIKKELLEERKKNYGFAIVDGIKEKLGNYATEPMAIFYGRGENPNRGKIKKNIYPEDVTINIGKNDKIPEPPKGHNWKEIVHSNKNIWLSRWIDPISNDNKYILFANESSIKGECDLVKYEKARKLQFFYKQVINKYTNDLTNGDTIKLKQLGTVTYLISNFGLRVGGEKDEDEAETIGASTLKVSNINITKLNTIIFDFLGKDSVRFYKELVVSPVVYNNMKLFMIGLYNDTPKNKDSLVFDYIDANEINKYLKLIDNSFTAKVFRTRLASYNMYIELQKINIPPSTTKQQIKVLFSKANKVIAELLNHIKTLTKKAQESSDKLQVQLEELLEQKKEKKKEGKSLEAIEKKILSKKNQIELKSSSLTTAMNTSLQNYIDPRIITKWCLQNDVPISVIYTATLQKKFSWAIENTNKEWDYLKTPLIGSNQLEPSNVEGKEIIEKNIINEKTKYIKLLNYCNVPTTKNLENVNLDVIKWIYKFSKYAFSKNINVKFNKSIIDYYESHLQNIEKRFKSKQ
jgi:DNA topoisomerase-1